MRMNENSLPADLVVDYIRVYEPRINWKIDEHQIICALGCDFSNNDLKNVKINEKDFGLKCKSTNKCTHFSWSDFNGGTCWMKMGNVSKRKSIVSSNFSAVCGLV